MLKSLFDHFLARPEKRATIAEKEVTIADKSVQIANALMSRMASELERLQTTLADAQKESEALRAELAELRAASELRAETTAAASRVAEVGAELAQSLHVAQMHQRNVEDRFKEINALIIRAMIEEGVDVDAATMAVLLESTVDRPDEGGGAVGAVPRPRR